MIYEQRIYKAVPGKLAAINARFANHTIGFFEEFNIGMVGFWNDEIGASNQLTYILSFDSMADREKKWGAFGAQGTSCWRAGRRWRSVGVRAPPVALRAIARSPRGRGAG